MGAPTPGTFCWIELAADDAAAAKRFYTAMFGWTATDNAIGPGENDVYTIYDLGGRNVAASYSMMQDQRDAGIPSNWLSYVATENADATAAKAGELGATLMADPFDVMEHGRMAVVQDPTGAVFALWQAKSHTGIGVWGEPNALAWNELATPDAARATEFYTSLFGWEAKPMSVDKTDYTVFGAATGMVGGMYQIRPEMQGMPPCWLPYFMVEDTDAAVDHARALGAQVHLSPMDVPTVGRLSMLQDPQGAMFYVITFFPPVDAGS
jgi:predicted enzyme related to lactoylglutathione lyase